MVELQADSGTIEGKVRVWGWVGSVGGVCGGWGWGGRGGGGGGAIKRYRPHRLTVPRTPPPPTHPPTHPPTTHTDVYPEHLKTYGYNAVAMTSVANTWIRGVSGVPPLRSVCWLRCTLLRAQRRPRRTPCAGVARFTALRVVCGPCIPRVPPCITGAVAALPHRSR